MLTQVFFIGARYFYQGRKARGGTQWNIFSSRGAPNGAIIGSYSLDLTFGCVVSLDTVATKWPAREGVSIHSGCPGEWPPLAARAHRPPNIESIIGAHALLHGARRRGCTIPAQNLCGTVWFIVGLAVYGGG